MNMQTILYYNINISYCNVNININISINNTKTNPCKIIPLNRSITPLYRHSRQRYRYRSLFHKLAILHLSMCRHYPHHMQCVMIMTWVCQHTTLTMRLEIELVLTITVNIVDIVYLVKVAHCPPRTRSCLIEYFTVDRLIMSDHPHYHRLRWHFHQRYKCQCRWNSTSNHNKRERELFTRRKNIVKSLPDWMASMMVNCSPCETCQHNRCLTQHVCTGIESFTPVSVMKRHWAALSDLPRSTPMRMSS